MALFLRRGLLFFAPFALYAMVIAIVDPFRYFELSDAIAVADKERIAGKVHYTLWKTQQFRREPAVRVLFGDSRIARLKPSDVERIAGAPYFNFAFGGGTVPEMVDAFWFATRHAQLEEAAFGVALFNFATSQNMNRFDEAEGLLDEKSLYFVNPSVAEASAKLLWDRWAGEKVNPEAPPMDRETFWKFQLDQAGTRVYGKFVYQAAYEDDFRKIADHCRRHGIRMHFVVPPSHVDLQAKVVEFGLAADDARFRAFLRSLAPTVDLDVPSELTRDRERFGDPFHPHNDEEIIAEVWGGVERYGVHTR